MDDQHRAPRDGDRDPVRDRIRRAVAEGRITAADGEIRLTNVTSAQSLTELSMIARDLDHLDAVQRAAAQQSAPVTHPVTQPASSTGPTEEPFGGAAAARAGRVVPWVIVAVVISIFAAGIIGLVALSSIDVSGRGSSSGELSDPLPEDPTGGIPDPGSTGAAEAPVPPPPMASFTLDVAGIKGFLADYRTRFSTTKVVDLTLYDEYVIVRVPIAGRQRNTGWRYADGRFVEFGPPMANFPGSELVDIAKLDLAKLLRNIATARRTLKVEDPNLTYVTINYRPQFDAEPNVNIYVSNEFSESGYLATTLRGGIERSYPFGG